jgi:hypothetical protein
VDARPHARQVKGDDPDKKGYPGPPGWGFGVGLTTPHTEKLTVTKVEQRKKLDGFNVDGPKRTKLYRNNPSYMERTNYDILVIARSLPALEALCVRSSSARSEKMDRLGDR